MVFFNSAVIMRFKVSQVVAFVKRIGFKVKARRIYVRSGYLNALFKRTLAYNGKDDRFSVIIDIHLVACFIFFIGVEFGKAFPGSKRQGLAHCKTLGLCLA